MGESGNDAACSSTGRSYRYKVSAGAPRAWGSAGLAGTAVYVLEGDAELSAYSYSWVWPVMSDVGVDTHGSRGGGTRVDAAEAGAGSDAKAYSAGNRGGTAGLGSV
jgi:hypothetical protein